MNERSVLFHLLVMCVIRREIGLRISLLRIFQRDKQDIIEFHIH